LLPCCLTPLAPTAAGNPAIRLFEVNTNNPQPITSFEGHTNNVTAVGFERDGRWMYSGSEDGTVKIWDLRASGFQREYESRGAVNSVVLHPNQARAQTRALGRIGLLCRAAAAG
jgi:G protein beta subunit-like protein